MTETAYLEIGSRAVHAWKIKTLSSVQFVHLFVCIEARVEQTLPEGDVVVGVTSLDDEIYVLRPKERDQVEVYDAVNYRKVRFITVPNSRVFTDMTSCGHYRCVYIADHGAECVHRVPALRSRDAQGSATQSWPVHDKPTGLSVNAAHNVLVTCRDVRKIKEFGSRGEAIHQMTLSNEVTNPWHSLQLASGQFVVCHSDLDKAMHGVSTISGDGRIIVNSHGGQRGSDSGHYSKPRHLAVDSSGFVYVADFGNRRVTRLSPALNYVCQVLTRDKLKGGPDKLCFDVQRSRLHVADNYWNDKGKRAGRVAVFSIHV